MYATISNISLLINTVYNNKNSKHLTEGGDMDILVYVVFGLVIIALIGMWIWVMRTVAKTSAMLEDATNEVEDIVEEVKLVAQDFTDVTDDLEQARIRDQTSPKTRRCTDTKDN